MSAVIRRVSTRERQVARVLWTIPPEDVASDWRHRTWTAPLEGGKAELQYHHPEWLLFVWTEHGDGRVRTSIYGEAMARQFALAALRAKRRLLRAGNPLAVAAADLPVPEETQ